MLFLPVFLFETLHRVDEISDPHSSETIENQVLHITEISSDILSIVLEYMKLKDEYFIHFA